MEIAQSRPRFRTDLVAEPIEEGGQRFVDVTDPDTGKTFRFYEVEYSIACALDGQTDLAGLVEWAQSELGLEPSPDELQTVIDTLADLGYLTDAPEVAAGPAATDLDVEDLALGHAGVVERDEPAPLPSGLDLELGLAGGSASAREEVTFVAPSLSLGSAGNERAERRSSTSEQSFSGLMEDDEDQVPTTIKRANQVAAARDAADAPPAGNGASPAALRPSGAHDADEDGPTKLPPPTPPEFDDEVSVDLSDHLHLGPDAVKEAVRQSKLMQAVTPEDVAEDVDDGEVLSLEKSERAASAPPVPRAETGRSADRSQPVELPDKPLSVSRPIEPLLDRESGPIAQPSKSRAGLLALLLLLIMAGAAGAVYYLNLFEIRARLGLEPDPSEAMKLATEGEEEPDEVEVPPPLPTATLETGEAPVTEVTAEERGALVSIVESGTEVQEGEVVARLRGIEAVERRIADHKNRGAVYQARVDRMVRRQEEAQSAGNAAAAKKLESEAARLQAKVEEKLELAAAEEEKLAPFVLTAPISGVVETSLAGSASFSASDVIFRVTGAPPLVATFTAPENAEYRDGSEVEVISEASEKRFDCKTILVEGTSVTVECPSDSGLQAGDQVALSP